MPVALRLTFPGGRYHATPWGRHVNEGVPEWPPSPWRLLRALVAVWQRTCPDLAVDEVRRLLGRLVEPPLFHLPRHRVAHTRHYMPWEKKGPQDRTLVFDTFVSVNREDSLWIGWPNTNLDAGEHQSLQQLVSNLSFLGRAEAWVDACVDSAAFESLDWNCVPAADIESNPIGVFCPDPLACFDDDQYPTLDSAKLAKGRIKPADYLFDCPRWHLCLDTETIHAHRWPSVPGAQWVNYTRPKVNGTLRFSQKPTVVSKKPTVARLLLDGPVLPVLTDSLLVGEAVRRAAMSCFGNWCRRHPGQAGEYLRLNADNTYASQIFSGKDQHGTCLAGPGHAHYWPIVSEADPRRIGSVVIFARDGFDPAEVGALAALRKLKLGKLGDLQVQLVGLGKTQDLGPTFVGPSNEWWSVTPFLGHGDIGVRGRSRFLRKGVRREWRRLAEHVVEFHDIELREVEELSAQEIHCAGLPQSREFRRARSKHGSREAYRPATMFRLYFSQPIGVPFSLGYANHFGMGQFRPLP